MFRGVTEECYAARNIPCQVIMERHFRLCVQPATAIVAISRTSKFRDRAQWRAQSAQTNDLTESIVLPNVILSCRKQSFSPPCAAMSVAARFPPQTSCTYARFRYSQHRSTIENPGMAFHTQVAEAREFLALRSLWYRSKP